MENIFDFNPSSAELKDIAFNPTTMYLRCGKEDTIFDKDFYLSNILPNWAIFDLALLFESREEQSTADQYWSQIPELAEEYLLGKDYELISA